jgi:hypothetical protein
MQRVKRECAHSFISQSASAPAKMPAKRLRRVRQK